MLTYIAKALFVFDFKKYADRLFRKRSSHGPMLAYLMLHLQVGIRTQTRTEIAILSNGPNGLKWPRLVQMAQIDQKWLGSDRKWTESGPEVNRK